MIRTRVMVYRLIYCKIIFLILGIFFVFDAALAEKATWVGVERIVAVGDVHGDFDQLVKTLYAAGVIDKNNKWIGGNTHLVQTGDIVDRGPFSWEAFDLLMGLEKQALEAGGRVHVLIGNHEALCVYGDSRHVHPEEFTSYGGKDLFNKAFEPKGKYGAWITKNNTVVKINDVLFVHGGISKKFSNMPLEKINDIIRRELIEGRLSRKKMKKSVSMDKSGPLWYRGLAREDEKVIETLLNTLAMNYGINRIVIGHTVSEGGIRMRAGGRVIQIDVGMSKYYRNGPAECLVIEKDNYFSVNPKQRKKLVIDND